MSTEHSIASRQPESVARAEQRLYLRPSCDVFENADEFLLLADLPGVSKEALSIHVDQGEVSIERSVRQHRSSERSCSLCCPVHLT